MSRIILGNRNRVGTPADVTAPAVPANLRKTASTTSSITVAWNLVSDISTPVKYDLDYSTVSGGGWITAIHDTTSLSYNKTGLSQNTTYWFRVRAYDSAGNYSDWSAEISTFTTWNGPTYVSTGGSGSYLYYRVGNVASTAYCFVGEFNMYTSTNGGGTKYPTSAASSSTTPTGYTWTGFGHASYPTWKIGDYLTSLDCWWSLGVSVAADNHATVQLPSAVTMLSGKIVINPLYTTVLKLYGSNDGSSFTEIGYFGNIVGNHYNFSTYYTFNF